MQSAKYHPRIFTQLHFYHYREFQFDGKEIFSKYTNIKMYSKLRHRFERWENIRTMHSVYFSLYLNCVCLLREKNAAS